MYQLVRMTFYAMKLGAGFQIEPVIVSLANEKNWLKEMLSIRGVPPEYQATAMGVFQAVYAVGMMAGPLTSGFLGTALGLSTVFYLAASLTLVIAIVALLPVFSRHSID